MSAPRYAVVIPACNEEACIGEILRELRETLDPQRFHISVGVNGSSDHTLRLAQHAGAVTAEADERGYGYGCQAAIHALTQTGVLADAYIFVAADGANDPQDIIKLTQAYEAGYSLVLGCRTTMAENRRVMGRSHVFANRLLGFWCACLTGRYFADIGPLRLIDRRLFESMHLQEWTYGWTIEAQIRAVVLRARILEVQVRERVRIAGEQKVSRVSWQHSLRIGLAILAAGWRSRFARVRDVQKPPIDIQADVHLEEVG